MSSPLAAPLRRVAAFAWDRPVAAAALVAGLLALAAWGIAHLRIDFSSTSFYGGDERAIRTLREFQERWGPDDDVVMVVVEAADGDLLTRDRIEAIGRIAGDLADVPDVRSVMSVADQRIVPPGGTLDDAVPLWELPRFDPGGPITREELLSHLPYVPLLLSIDATRAAVVVRLAFSSDDAGASVPAVARIEAVVRAHDGRSGLSLGVAGVPAVRAGFIRLTIADQRVLVPASLALIGLSLFWIFRRAHGVLVPAAAALVPLALLLGLMGWAGEPIGLLSQAYFTLIPVLALSGAVHLVARFHEEHPERGARDALLQAVEHAGLACTLTAAATIVGFASLGLGATPMLTRFGWFAAAGLAIAYAMLFVVVPLLLRMTRATAPAAAPRRLLGMLSGFATRHPLTTLAASLAIGAAATSAGSRVVVDNRLSNLLESDHPVRQAGAVLDRSLGGTLSLELELTGPDEAFLQPEIVSVTAAFEDWAAAEPGVRAVIGPGRTLEAVAASTRTVMATPDAIRAVYGRLSTLIDPALVVTRDYRRARVSIRVAEPGGRAFEAFANTVLAEARATFVSFGVEPVVTGTTLVAYAGVNQLAGTVRAGLLSVFVVVAVMFLVLFRSPTLMLLALLPNALPLVVGYSTIGLLGLDLDPLSGIILDFGLGIAVDDTIHVLMRVREGVRGGETLAQGIESAIAHSGRAVAITTVVISGGLATNVLSSFPPLQVLGILGAVMMLSALAFNLTLLPALLVLARAERALVGRHPVN